MTVSKAIDDKIWNAPWFLKPLGNNWYIAEQLAQINRNLIKYKINRISISIIPPCLHYLKHGKNNIDQGKVFGVLLAGLSKVFDCPAHDDKFKFMGFIINH